MRYPLCSHVQAVEGALIAHLLREHVEPRAAAALGLPVGTLLLARRPTGLFTFYLGLMVLALLIAAPSARLRR
jgi:hypothetical protein